VATVRLAEKASEADQLGTELKNARVEGQKQTADLEQARTVARTLTEQRDRALYGECDAKTKLIAPLFIFQGP